MVRRGKEIERAKGVGSEDKRWEAMESKFEVCKKP